MIYLLGKYIYLRIWEIYLCIVYVTVVYVYVYVYMQKFIYTQ